jgi:hypothetical protein
MKYIVGSTIFSTAENLGMPKLVWFYINPWNSLRSINYRLLFGQYVDERVFFFSQNLALNVELHFLQAIQQQQALPIPIPYALGINQCFKGVVNSKFF